MGTAEEPMDCRLLKIPSHMKTSTAFLIRVFRVFRGYQSIFCCKVIEFTQNNCISNKESLNQNFLFDFSYLTHFNI
jgi:hypothetical protein